MSYGGYRGVGGALFLLDAHDHVSVDACCDTHVIEVKRVGTVAIDQAQKHSNRERENTVTTLGITR
jgi:Ser-tRNA(Ala) deacylase AlaX